MTRSASRSAAGLLTLASAFAFAHALTLGPAPLAAQEDPVVQRIIELGTTDN